MKLLSTDRAAADTPHPPAQEAIAQRAKELWERYGCPTDRDQEIWLEAERQLLAAAPITSSTPAAEIAPPPIEKDSKPRSRTRVSRGRAAS